MAIEPLLVVAFAAGSVEGYAILSDLISNDNKKRRNQMDQKPQHTDPKLPILKNSLLPSSMFYGSIALPLSLIGASPDVKCVTRIFNMEKLGIPTEDEENFRNTLVEDSVVVGTNASFVPPGKISRKNGTQGGKQIGKGGVTASPTRPKAFQNNFFFSFHQHNLPFAEGMRRVRFLCTGAAIFSSLAVSSEKMNGAHALGNGDNEVVTNSHVALRLISNESNIYTPNMIKSKRSQFDTFPVLVPRPSFNDFDDNSSAYRNKKFRICRTFDDWKNLPIHDSWFIKRKNGSQNLKILLVEADITRSFSESLSVGVDPTNAESSLSQKSLQLSNRLIEMIINKKSAALNDTKKTEIINVLVSTGNELSNIPNSVSVNSLDALASIVKENIDTATHSRTILNKKNEFLHEQIKTQTHSLDPTTKIKESDSCSPEIHSYGNEKENTPPSIFTMVTLVGKMIRNVIPAILHVPRNGIKLFPPISSWGNSSKKNTLHVFSSSRDIKGWIESFIDKQEWAVFWHNSEVDEIHKLIEVIKREGENRFFFLVCGTDDDSTIECVCSLIESFEEEKKNSIPALSQSDQSVTNPPIFDVNAVVILEHQTSSGKLNSLVQHYNSSVYVQQICIPFVHNEIFENVRELLLSGKTVKEVQSIMNTSYKK